MPAVIAASTGSIPACAGNPSMPAVIAASTGSIPACAGEPPTGMTPDTPGRVYPRVCGGTSRRGYWRGIAGGLSPRVRGNPELQAALLAAGRSIPACAGEPEFDWAAPRVAEVYPRVCGGTAEYTRRTGILAGLSPRVRGNHHRRGDSGGQRGSIPACAGEPRADLRRAA